MAGAAHRGSDRRITLPENRAKKRRYTTIRRSLLVNLLVMVTLMSAALIVTASYGTRRAVRTLSELVLIQTVEHTESELSRFFAPVSENLELVSTWARNGVLDITDRGKLNRLLVPMLAHNSQISSILLADEQGCEYMLLKTADGRWMNRETRLDEWGGRSRLWTWRQGETEVHSEWKRLHYNPHRRPWYKGALDNFLAGDTPGEKDGRRFYITRPYTLFTTKEPGITASLAFEALDGRIMVTAFDVLLRDITRFTMSLKVSSHGKVVVLSDQDDRVIGLPRYERFRDRGKRRQALLKKIGQLGIPVVTDAIRHYRSHPAYGDRIFTFKSSGESWWAIVRPFNIDAERVMRITVVVPEVDLLGSLKLMWLWILLIVMGIVLLAVKRIFTLAGRYSRPIEKLVQESHRIARGDLEQELVIDAPVEEFQRLAKAHDEMRRGLRVLLKMERDVQIAQKIQQDTLPRKLPRLPGYEITGWSQPAEGAAGDTFDVIGLLRDAHGNERGFRICDKDAHLGIFLLADASGHGIGPALSVTQVRAMLRMAVRSGQNLMAIIRLMNRQLEEDLHEGRFITAWFGELDPVTNRLASFSLGQAPLLHYRREEDDCRSLMPQLPPFGTIDEIGQEQPEVVEMAPGDIFAVLSDGLYEPRNAAGRMFGRKRVIEILRARHRQPPGEILRAILAEIDRFTGNAPADDDRTAVIIKRKAGSMRGEG